MYDKESLRIIADGERRWDRETTQNSLKRAPERRESFTTLSGIPVERLYTPDNIANIDYLNDLGFPGNYPYTRGPYPTMHRGQLWTMRMFAGFGSAQETNQRFKYLLEHGQTGLSVAFDFPTLNGYDSDHPMAQGEFGKCGVAVSSLKDMEVLFDGIPMGKVTTSMTINGPAAIIWAMHIAAAENQGVGKEKLRGTIQNDILKDYMSQKSFIFPPKPSIRLVVDTIEFASKNMPYWHPISISGYHIREAGSTAVQELAFTLANGIAYVEACLERGLDVDSFAPRLSFFFNVHNDFFEEIAKFRAARRIWARLMKERFGARKPESMRLRFHAQTAGCALTAQQPEINVVRVALQTLAAVLGGCQSLHTNSMDEALALPSEKAVQVALRTQQIVAHESGVTKTIDPLAGSYYLEWLTNEMEERAMEYIQKIDEMGGAVNAMIRGYQMQEIANASYLYQKRVESKEEIVVGVNEYVLDEEITIPLLEMDPEGERRQLERLARLRAERDNRALQRKLDDLKRAAEGNENLMPYLIEAVRAYGTLGEITGSLKAVFGEYIETPVL